MKNPFEEPLEMLEASIRVIDEKEIDRCAARISILMEGPKWEGIVAVVKFYKHPALPGKVLFGTNRNIPGELVVAFNLESFREVEVCSLLRVEH